MHSFERDEVPSVVLAFVGLAIIGWGGQWYFGAIQGDGAKLGLALEVGLLGYLIAGIGSLFIAIRGFRTHDPALPAAVIVGVAAFAGSLVVDVWGAVWEITSNMDLAGLVVLLITILPAVLVWYAIRRTAE